MAAQVRRATSEDAHRIAAVHVSSWQATYAYAFPADFLASLSVSEREGMWRAALREGKETILVADDGGLIAGFCCAAVSRDEHGGRDTGELWALYVDPGYWATGIGAQLHDAALQAFSTSGFREATLWVLDSNDRARSFYERHAWTPDGAVKHAEIGGNLVVEVRYRRALAVE